MDWRAGVCQSVGNGTGRWLHYLSRDQAMDAAIQLHRYVCREAVSTDIVEGRLEGGRVAGFPEPERAIRGAHEALRELCGKS